MLTIEIKQAFLNDNTINRINVSNIISPIAYQLIINLKEN